MVVTKRSRPFDLGNLLAASTGRDTTMGAPISVFQAPTSKKGWLRAYRTLFQERGIEVPPPDNCSKEQLKGWNKFLDWKRLSYLPDRRAKINPADSVAKSDRVYPRSAARPPSPQGLWRIDDPSGSLQTTSLSKSALIAASESSDQHPSH